MRSLRRYELNGWPRRSFGELRATGQEKDRALHEALNVGLVLPIPRGGYYYVFPSGVPLFRKYDADGKLLFERHVEGIEVDSYLREMPRSWPRRRTDEGEIPLVPSIIRTAGVDAGGNLWISLTAPFTYVYDSRGDKRRTLQFRAAGILAPPASSSLLMRGCSSPPAATRSRRNCSRRVRHISFPIGPRSSLRSSGSSPNWPPT